MQPALFSRRELADISLIFKLINGFTDVSDLLNCIPFNIPAYNSHSSFLFYLSVHSINYLKNSALPRALALCNKFPSRVDFFHTPLREILNVYINNVYMLYWVRQTICIILFRIFIIDVMFKVNIVFTYLFVFLSVLQASAHFILFN